ncbi:MAG: coproporphyrinogen oxidase, partial [Dehalococcoidia bacterium]|nr:coproporphyrinogen oxidase [Dehalococcoidia bacterium]
VREGTDLYGKLTAGDFQPLSEDETVAEIGELIQRLECHSEIKSDHIMNLLPEVEGKLPEDKPRIIAIINRYLGMSPQQRLHYRLGRRAGYYEKLEDTENPICRDGVSTILGRLDFDDNLVETAVDRLKKTFI